MAHADADRPAAEVGAARLVDDATGEPVESVGAAGAPGARVREGGDGAVVELARAEGKHRYLHAFPSVDNAASNALCRSLGFTLCGEHKFEYPKGNPMRCSDWRLDLAAAG